MSSPSGGRRRKKPCMSPGDDADHITGLPLELRARISSFLPFRQVGQLSSLSRPWRRIDDHTPVVHLNLEDFVTGGILNEDAIAALQAAFRRRAEDDYFRSCKVDILRISYRPDDRRMTLHAQRIIELADDRQICINFAGIDGSRSAWTLVTPQSMRDLELVGFHIVPTIGGPGAAALQTLFLHRVSLWRWPRLPSLRSLRLHNVNVDARFRPGTWCPQLEYLGISNSWIDHHRVEICLPHLKALDIDNVHVGVDLHPYKLGDITIDCPQLEKLDMDAISATTPDYELFTMRVPRLCHLIWRNQFAKRVDLNFGRPSSVTSGLIEFTVIDSTSSNRRKMEEFQAKMMQMLQGILPELPPDGVADAARPYMTHDKYPLLG